MPQGEIKNAVVEGTKLGFDRGIFLCAWLHLKYNGGGQGFGGYVLGRKDSDPAGSYAEVFIKGILETLDVKRWEDLKGVSCRVDADRGKVYGIGHYLKDKWFYPKEAFAKLEAEDNG